MDLLLFASPDPSGAIDYVDTAISTGVFSLLAYIVTKLGPGLLAEVRGIQRNFQEEMALQRTHDATEGRYEREACEKHFSTLSKAITDSNLSVSDALQGFEKSHDLLADAIKGIVIVSSKIADKGHA